MHCTVKMGMLVTNMMVPLILGPGPLAVPHSFKPPPHASNESLTKFSGGVLHMFDDSNLEFLKGPATQLLHFSLHPSPQILYGVEVRAVGGAMILAGWPLA